MFMVGLIGGKGMFMYGRIDRWRERDVYGRIVLIDSIIFAYSEKCSSNYRLIKYQKLV